MSYILNIDTAFENPNVSIAQNGLVLAKKHGDKARDQGAFLHPAINQIMQDASFQLADISAVAAIIGPGSYTGLRVGLAAAKGICYALNKPLIAVQSLAALAAAALPHTDAKFICPMIDARRMEVFTAVYDRALTETLAPCAMILDGASLQAFENQKIAFCGNGIEKFRNTYKNPEAQWLQINDYTNSFASLANDLFSKHSFADVALCEPLYLKEFYTA